MTSYTDLVAALQDAIAGVDPLELADTSIDLMGEYEMEATFAARLLLRDPSVSVAAAVQRAFNELMETPLGVGLADRIAEIVAARVDLGAR